MHIAIVAGEYSGDLLGAELIKALRERKPDIQFSGVAGPAMLAEGCDTLFPIDRLAVMGIVEPLLRLPELLRMRRNIYRHYLQNRPDVFIGIDSPEFNLTLEMNLKKAGIRVVHYVSPSVWAWRQKRVHTIAKAVDLVLALFPFEVKFYKQFKVPARFIGHPLADKIPLQVDQLTAKKALNIDPNVRYVALLPGSRRQELQHMADTFIQTAALCWQKKPELQFLMPAVNPERKQQFLARYQALNATVPIQIIDGHSQAVMAASDAVLVASGTATLEAMLLKRPMVIVYRAGMLMYQVARRLVKIKNIGLPNLLTDQALIPEFIQDAAQPENIAPALLDFLDHPEKVKILQDEFTKVHQELRRDASRQAARAVLNLIEGKNL